jgi:hypothetical protein
MSRGPLPDPNRRRRNAPTIPTTNLPASGRKGRAPQPLVYLGAAGTAWWRWAWRLPQACGWSEGDLAMIGRRASLEDDLATIAKVEGLDFLDALEEEKAAKVRETIQRLAALATGKLALCREARELDDRLGLTPKGLAALRWKIVADVEPVPAAGTGVVTSLDSRRAASVAS